LAWWRHTGRVLADKLGGHEASSERLWHPLVRPSVVSRRQRRIEETPEGTRLVCPLQPRRHGEGSLLVPVPAIPWEPPRPQRWIDFGYDRIAEAVQQYENGCPIRTRGARLGKQRHDWNTRLGCAVIHLRYFFAGDGGASSLSMSTTAFQPPSACFL
jgi:hypothetical protein